MSMASSDWSEISPSAITGWGLRADGGSGGVTTGVESNVATASSTTPPLYSPDNPLFWVGGLLILVGGFVGLSGWVDLGPIKGKASV